MCALNSLLSVWLIIGHGNVLLIFLCLIYFNWYGYIYNLHTEKKLFFVIKIPFCSYSAKNSWITYIGSEQRPQRININKKISEKMVEYFFFIFSASLYTSYKMDFSYVSFRFLFFFCCSTFFQNIRQELHLPWRIKICLWWMQVIWNISYFIFYFFQFLLNMYMQSTKPFISLQWENI